MRGLRQRAVGKRFDADIGSLSGQAQLAIVERHVSEAVANGARALVGGKRADAPGAFFEPTVLVDVDASMRCMREETFGPTLPVMKVTDVEEAIRFANDSSYGLRPPSGPAIAPAASRSPRAWRSARSTSTTCS